MDIILLLVGVLVGGILATYIGGLRYKQSHVLRTDFDGLGAKFNETVTALNVEAEKVKSLTDQLSDSNTSLKDKEKIVLEQSGTLATLRSELEAERRQTAETEGEREKGKTALETQRVENERLSTSLAKADAQLEAKTKSLTTAEDNIKTLQSEVTSKTAEITSLTAQVADLKAQKQAADEKLETQKSEIEAIRRLSEAEFKNIATQILEEKSERFTALNKTNLETILKPLGENIDGFKKKVDEVYEKESQQRFSLSEKIAELVTLNNKISEEANNLTHALEGSSKIQGDWGEWILESVLERSGLVKGREFQVQEFMRDDSGNILKNEDGTKMRPDVIINYPDHRKVIVDSKVSLVAYKRMSFADTPEEQKAHLQEHLASIKKHINDLSAKNYPDFARGLDFVMMFIPIEPAFLVAMHADPELWSYAYSKRVLLISPTNLIAVVKLIADLWTREYQNLNAIEIAERGGALYDKFVGFVEALSDIGSSIERTQKSYDTAVSRLKDGKGNVLRQVENLRLLGVKSKKTLPLGFIPEPDDVDPALLDSSTEEFATESSKIEDAHA